MTAFDFLTAHVQIQDVNVALDHLNIRSFTCLMISKYNVLEVIDTWIYLLWINFGLIASSS